MAGVNLNIPVSPFLKSRLNVTARKYGVSVSTLVRDMLENIVPYDANDPPDDFIERTNIETLIKSHAPVRTTIPFVASILNLNFDNMYVIAPDERKFKIEQFPDHGLLCVIYMYNQLYRIYKRIG